MSQFSAYILTTEVLLDDFDVEDIEWVISMTIDTADDIAKGEIENLLANPPVFPYTNNEYGRTVNNPQEFLEFLEEVKNAEREEFAQFVREKYTSRAEEIKKGQEKTPPTLINLTPHDINIIVGEETITVPPSGTVARCAEVRQEKKQIGNIPVSLATFGEVQGLPEPEPGKAYIVSALVLNAVPWRKDVFAPGPLVRDESGQVKGCRGLSCTPAY